MSDLIKLALSPTVIAGMSRSLKGLGAGVGMGGATGGVLGAAVGGVGGYRKARAEGHTPSESITGALGGVAKGAIRGGALGAIGGGALGAARPAYAEALSRHLPASSRFGQRQVHSLTGVGDAHYLRSIGGGSAPATNRVRGALKERLERIPGADKKLRKARLAEDASLQAERMGLHSIPGYVKSLAHNPLKTLSVGAKDQWANLGTGGRALMYGLPTVGVASELANPSTESGAGRFERAGRVVGAAGSSMVAPFSIGGDLVAGGVLSGGLGRAGRWLDNLKRRKGNPPPSAPVYDPVAGSTQPSEHIISDRASGIIPEGTYA